MTNKYHIRNAIQETDSNVIYVSIYFKIHRRVGEFLNIFKLCELNNNILFIVMLCTNNAVYAYFVVHLNKRDIPIAKCRILRKQR